MINSNHQFGFGLGEASSGSMPGSDIFTASVAEDGTVSIFDRYATAKALPQEDECNHWILGSGSQYNGNTTVEVMRPLVTGDPQDRPFSVGSIKVFSSFFRKLKFSDYICFWNF